VEFRQDRAFVGDKAAAPLDAVARHPGVRAPVRHEGTRKAGLAVVASRDHDQVAARRRSGEGEVARRRTGQVDAPPRGAEIGRDAEIVRVVVVGATDADE
jgi:hypothetical protein